MNAFTRRHEQVNCKMGFTANERRHLKSTIREAIAWGVPCQESRGYAPSEFIQLLHKALKEIEQLEAEVDRLKVSQRVG